MSKTWMIGTWRFTLSEPYEIVDEHKNVLYGTVEKMRKYRVDVTVETERDLHLHGAFYGCDYTGSANDFKKRRPPLHKEVIECVAQEIMNAYTDPVEFMSMAFMEPPESTEYIKQIYDLVTFARDYGEELEGFMPEECWEEEALYELIRKEQE